jgi:ubiquitin-protein ligase
LDAAPGATVTLPNPNSNMTLNVSIKVIDSASPWYGATYDFVVTVPDQFPIQAPRAECKTMVRFSFDLICSTTRSFPRISHDFGFI